MRINIKRVLFAIAGLAIASTASAYDFESGGLYYNILPGTTNLEVTHDGGDQMMNQCYRNEEYIIPESVEHDGTTYTVTRIGDRAFNYSYAYFITMPSTLESIGEQPFIMSQLKNITFLGSKAPELVDENSLTRDWGMYTGVTLYVPDANLSTYRKAYINEDSETRWMDVYSIEILSNKPVYLNGVYYGNKDNDQKTIEVTGSEGWISQVVIPSTVDVNGVTYTVTRIGGLYNGGSEISIPETVTQIEFGCLYNFSTVNISENNPKFKSYGNYIVETEGLTNKLVWSRLLTEIPSDVNALDNNSLYLEDSIYELEIPNTITSIDSWFMHNSKENMIYICYVEDPYAIGENAFRDGIVYVDNDKLAAYTERFMYYGITIKSIDLLPVEVDGTIYEINSLENKTASVIRITGTTSLGYMEASVDIKPTVEINGETYTVNNIKSNAFNGFWVTNLNLPATITSLDDCIFGDNSSTSYATIVCEGDVPPTVMSTRAFPGQYNWIYNEDYGYSDCVWVPSAVCYVPDNAVDTYKSTYGWSELSILPLSEMPINAFIDNISYHVTDKVNKECEISYYAHWASGGQEQVTIPASNEINGVNYNVTSISDNAFSNSESTKTFVFESTVPPTLGGPQALGYSWRVNTIFVPEGSVSDYINAWSEYSEYTNKIQSSGNIITSIDLVDGETIYNNGHTFFDVDITYTRDFKTTAWQALYVPFELSIEEWNEAGLQIAQINNVHQYDFDEDGTVDNTVLESFVKKTGRTKANTPYLVKADAQGEVTISTTGTLMPSYENSIECSSMSTSYSFRGTYNGVNSMYMYGYYAFDLEGNLCQAASYSTTLGGFRWYVETYRRGTYDDNNPYMARVITLSVDGEIVSGETTGIANISNDSLRDSNVIYGLDGRIVSKDGNETSLPAGIYVKNGKKFLKK